MQDGVICRFLVILCVYQVYGAFPVVCKGAFTCVLRESCGKQRDPTKILLPCNRLRSMVCCPSVTPSVLLPQAPVTAEQATIVTTTAAPRDLKMHKSFSLLPDFSSCGHSSQYYDNTTVLGASPAANKVVDGTNAKRGKYPWMVHLIFQPENGNFSYGRCGGSLINNRYVLTAAHCFADKEYDFLHVRLGEYNTSESCHETGLPCPQDIPIEKIILHNYNTTSYRQDIALLRLSREVSPNHPGIAPVCLPFDLKELKLKNAFIAAGWGLTADVKNGKPPAVLQVVELHSNGMCNMCDNAPYCFLDHIHQLCLQQDKGKKDVCHGDSGGPLLFKRRDEGQYIQVGIVSYKTHLCGTEQVPTIYTRVDAYLQWILDKLEP